MHPDHKKPVACTICNKFFKSKRTLRVHINKFYCKGNTVIIRNTECVEAEEVINTHDDNEGTSMLYEDESVMNSNKSGTLIIITE